MIDNELLNAELQKQESAFWCVTEEEREALLTELDLLGWQWRSGDRLLELNGDNYAVRGGICYLCDKTDKTVTRDRNPRGLPLVEIMIPDISVPEEMFLGLLGAGV